MNRRLLMVIIIIMLALLVTACGGKKETVSPTTQEAAQVSNSTQASVQPEASSTPAAQPAEASQATPTSTPTEELTQVPTSAQPSPTEVPASTQETVVASSPSSTTSAQTAASPTAPACVNKAAFYEDVTIPDDTVIRQGDKFTKTWRVRNEGDCDWKGYQLVYAGGEAMNATLANSVPDAAPGSIVDISVDMTAPGRGGTYLSYWQFSTTGGQTFGVGSGANGLLWARIQVDYVSGQDATSATSSTSQQSTATTTVSTSSGTSSSTTTSSTPAGCNYSLNPGYESQILDLINKARADNGLSPVTRSSELDAAALEHSLDMACNDFISHTGSDGSLWYQRVAKQGFANSNSARENIYTGSPDFGGDANGAFTWWMNSQIHRDNILYSSVTEVGISYVYSSNATYGGLYTMVLARP